MASRDVPVGAPSLPRSQTSIDGNIVNLLLQVRTALQLGCSQQAQDLPQYSFSESLIHCNDTQGLCGSWFATHGTLGGRCSDRRHMLRQHLTAGRHPKYIAWLDSILKGCMQCG